MEDEGRVARVVLGVGLTVGLVAFGLTFTGVSVPSFSLFGPTIPDKLHGLQPLPGSDLTPPQSLLLNGQPTDVAVCRSNQSVADVVEHYRRIASRETKAGVPYVHSSSPAGGSILWVTKDGLNKAVLVQPEEDGHGSVYRLIVDDNRQALTRQPTELPGGLRSLPGFTVTMSVGRANGAGSVFMDANGEPGDVAARLLNLLAEAGYRSDRTRLAAYQAQSKTKRTRRLTIPFQHGARSLSGHLVVEPAPAGSTRVCLTFRA